MDQKVVKVWMIVRKVMLTTHLFAVLCSLTLIHKNPLIFMYCKKFFEKVIFQNLNSYRIIRVINLLATMETYNCLS